MPRAKLDWDKLVLPTVLSPRISTALEYLCKDAIAYTGNHANIRQRIVELVFGLREMAEHEHGHSTLDVINISNLLKRSDPRQQEAQHSSRREDVLSYLSRKKKLNGDQVRAANVIRDIWQNFNRFLSVSISNYSPNAGGAAKTRALAPVDIMGQAAWDIYRMAYCPWYNELKSHYSASHGTVTRPSVLIGHAQIVIGIIIEGQHPHVLDKALHFTYNGTLKILINELDIFDDYLYKLSRANPSSDEIQDLS